MRTEDFANDRVLDRAVRDLLVPMPRSRAWEREERERLIAFIESGERSRAAGPNGIHNVGDLDAMAGDMEIVWSDPESALVVRAPGRGRRRAVAALGAAAIVAGTVAGGYVITRSRDTGAGPARAAEDTPTTEPAASDTVPGVAVPGASGGVGFHVTSGPGDGIDELSRTTPLAERVTSDGFTLRVYPGGIGMLPGSGSRTDTWSPAPWCESGDVMLTLTGNGLRETGVVGRYDEPANGRAVSAVLLGTAADQPRWVVVAQVPADTPSVSVTFADGATDAATPQNGFALLTVPADESVLDVAGDSIVMPEFVTDIDGGSASGTVDSTAWSDPQFIEACTRPTAVLPEAGVQPEDPAVAEEAIVTAMTALYDASVRGERDIYVDDPTGVGEARDALDQGVHAQAAATAQAYVEEVVFTSPTEAAFIYRVESSNGVMGDRLGGAVLIDGIWKITRQTVCQDLASAGGDCDADVDDS